MTAQEALEFLQEAQQQGYDLEQIKIEVNLILE